MNKRWNSESVSRDGEGVDLRKLRGGVDRTWWQIGGSWWGLRPRFPTGGLAGGGAPPQYREHGRVVWRGVMGTGLSAMFELSSDTQVIISRR